MFLLLVFFILLREGEAAAACRLAAKASEAALEQHNLLREKVASRQLDKAIYGNLPGSKSLFKLKYDCTNEGLALATIGNKCKHSSIYMDKVGRGENFITYRLKTNPKPEQLAELFEYAVEDWSLTVENPLSADVVYTDTTMEPFANMIYNKTLKIGCAYLFCKDQGKVALACVYEKRPIEGEPLYWADSKNDKGCTKDAPCKKLIKGAVCSSNNGKVGPLCLQEPPPGKFELMQNIKRAYLRQKEYDLKSGDILQIVMNALHYAHSETTSSDSTRPIRGDRDQKIMSDASKIQLKMADLFAVLVAQGDVFVVEEESLLNLIKSSKAKPPLPPPPQPRPPQPPFNKRKRPAFKPILTNEETFAPKRKCGPPPPPPTTPKVTPVSETTTAGPSGEQSVEQFMKMIKEFFKSEETKEKQEAKQKEDLDDIFSVD
ncbi:unnamed protein product [Cylicocyclus nassatus]|uniref:SCP domain-containing protein n=1 Tax=Cylicocyclus nassatus TaxID=53992 RepID=A0AA36M586_CYLNA|nr:unnamed protein product [Cylicocyclus nassatus]